MSDDMDDRYSRQSILEGIGHEGQAKLKHSKVLIVGAGGLGCPSSQYLAAAGIGHIVIIDEDVVDESNLGRQILHFDADKGEKKVLSAKNKLEAINPDIQIDVHIDRFNQSNAKELIQGCDFVIDGADNFTTKFLINDACYLLDTPFSHAGVVGFEGQTMTVVPRTSSCYRCLFIEPPDPNEVPNCNRAGVLGPVVGTIGCIQATEAIKTILGLGENLAGNMLIYQALSQNFRRVKVPKNPDCPLCGEKPSISKIAEQGIKHVETSENEGEELYLLTFKNSQTVILAQRSLQKLGLKVESRVTPRQLSHECGICLEVRGAKEELIKKHIRDCGLETIRCAMLKKFY